MRILITGASGFVGKHLVAALSEKFGGELELLQVSTGGVLPPEVIDLDISNYGRCLEVFGQFRPELVYHLAAISFPPQAEESFGKTLSVNVLGTDNVCRALIASGNRDGASPALVHVSTSEVYGSDVPLPVDVDCPVRPTNSYGLSKLMSELVVERYHSLGKLRALVCRPFNHIGPGQDERFVASSFAWQCAEIALGRMEPTVQVGNLEAQRDFCDVRDVVRGYVASGVWLQQQPLRAELQRLIFCSGIPVKISDILTQLIAFTGKDVKIVLDPKRMRPSDIPLRYGSANAAHKLLGWKPHYKLEQTLKDLFDDWKSRLLQPAHPVK